MPVSPCFSYPSDVPPGAGSPGSTQPPLPGVRRMPLICYSYPSMCFSYPDDVPLGGGNRDGAQLSLSEVRRMPAGSCFRY